MDLSNAEMGGSNIDVRARTHISQQNVALWLGCRVKRSGWKGLPDFNKDDLTLMCVVLFRHQSGSTRSRSHSLKSMQTNNTPAGLSK